MKIQHFRFSFFRVLKGREKKKEEQKKKKGIITMALASWHVPDLLDNKCASSAASAAKLASEGALDVRESIPSSFPLPPVKDVSSRSPNENAKKKKKK